MTDDERKALLRWSGRLNRNAGEKLRREVERLFGVTEDDAEDRTLDEGIAAAAGFLAGYRAARRERLREADG